MDANREFHNHLRSARARFYLADFHVHSPASADVRLAPRFNDLSTEAKRILDSIPEPCTGNPVQYELQVIHKYPPSIYFQDLIAKRDAVISQTGDSGGDDWAIIAITDHNVCKYSCELASLSWDNLSQHRLVILPGIELSVNYPVPVGGSRAEAHILCLFSPKTSDSDIRLAIAAASGTNWAFGERLTLQSLPSFIDALRHHHDYPGLCIAAHVSSTSGVQSETRKTILSRLDAAISRVKGELETGEKIDSEELNQRLLLLEQEREGTDQISIEILGLVGLCGFDALQVRGRHDEIHYRRLHRFRDRHGRAVPIVCSDAHRPEDVFITESGIPHIKLSVSSAGAAPDHVFDAIRYALRLGETRFSYVAPGSPLYWIAGVQITPDAPNPARFWPSADGQEDVRSFIFSLSRNLNCLIGGRGSGKSAALEAIAFLARPTDFEGFEHSRDEDLPDFYSRSKATIGGCKLAICWQFMGHEQTLHLPKHAVFASRYFDPSGRHESVLYSNADDVELLPEQIPDHSIQYFRLGEIEQQAGPERLRNLFDQICGNEIKAHEQRIQKIMEKLTNQRTEMVELSRAIEELTRDSAPLREFAKRKALFDEVNIPEVREAYEEVDRTAAAAAVAEKAIRDWSKLQNEFDLPAITEEISGYFQGIRESCVGPKGEIKPYHQELAVLSSDQPVKNGEKEPPLVVKVSAAVDNLDAKLKKVDQEFQTANQNIVSHGKTARDALAARGLPAGGKDREAKKKAFDDALAALAKYRQLINEWEELNRNRIELVKALQKEGQQRSNLRQETASGITKQLKRDLESCVLIIEADAQPDMDKGSFWNWLDAHFSLQSFRYRKARMEALIAQGLTPWDLRRLLLQESGIDHSRLQVQRDCAENGAIDEAVAKMLLDHCIGRRRLGCEVMENAVDPTFWNELPQEIRDGLITFPTEEKGHKELKVNDVLQLDEIIFDDVPQIRLNDRPNDPLSKPRPIESLSPGQRCSAVLPILLLTGSSPLIIDQPEDNMDNRLIRQVIVNILSSIKLRRQVILATHNPNLPVLGDVELAIILQGVGERECEVKAIGDLDSRELVHHLTEVMEGGREAFQYRQTIYQTHWPGPVFTSVQGE